ncbi:high mobility group nucleosome-binding domain-containing protein 5-like [Centroberyx affinis]|uniref:high mobility group nucleosome-binding domain-containing protein 5-like n=1 Tax=Centroberyx affinis TaxID=166261 RepID=UPI003A5C5024
MKELRMRAEAEVEPQVKHGTFVVEKPRNPEAAAAREPIRPPPAQDIEAALRQIRQENREERRELDRRHGDKKGITFEIRLDDEGQKEEEEAEQQREERGEEDTEEKRAGDGGGEEEREDPDPLNQTLSFQAGEQLKLRDWSAGQEVEARRGWSQEAPRSLLDALANMAVSSVYDATAQSGPGEEEAAGRRQWGDGPPNTLLLALAQAEITSSTLGSLTPDPENDRAEEEEEEEEEERKGDMEEEEEEEEDSDVEVDEERLEPRSDDDDTNFEESEDELREEVADSMKNLFILDDREGGEEAEGGEEEEAGGGEEEEEEEEGFGQSAADPQQTQTEPQDSQANLTAGPSEAERPDENQTQDNKDIQ